jgi:NUDIX domain
VFFRDEQSRVLVVETTYKPEWEIPGGGVEADETPWAAATRERRAYSLDEARSLVRGDLHDRIAVALHAAHSGRLILCDAGSPSAQVFNR